ncbi:Dps family protein [Spirochaeta cellobiosiphila]|uniref:Dps family protein n=1 Tax=Spirochaeta cellobiosiphila TaxID=504483 RepID=UPI00041A5FAF|nr:DNA starvation/stationary phase protection protein [Spirochaeta cellobiosiphila]
METVKKMNSYLADLAVMNVKLHNLHWNVVGKQFVSIHKFTEELYEDLFEKYDAVAEELKMLGEIPASTMVEYLKITDVKEESPRAFTVEEVLDHLVSDLNILKTKALHIRKSASEEDSFAVANMMEDHSSEYNKNLWFLKAMLAA